MEVAKRGATLAIDRGTSASGQASKTEIEIAAEVRDLTPLNLLRTDKMIHERHRRRARGFSSVELLIVLAIAGILSAIAFPQMIAQRRLLRFSGLTREFNTQLRYARQLAMSQRQAITFQYNDTTKTIRIIDHNNDPAIVTSGTAVLADPAYPSTALPARVVVNVSLLQGGLPSSEIMYSTPISSTGLPTGHVALPTTLPDGIAMTPLAANIINITFQPDGSVINPVGVPVGGITLSAGTRMDSAIFIFNRKAPIATAAAISVMGASGRVKVWRYIDSAANIYAE